MEVLLLEAEQTLLVFEGLGSIFLLDLFELVFQWLGNFNRIFEGLNHVKIMDFGFLLSNTLHFQLLFA